MNNIELIKMELSVHGIQPLADGTFNVSDRDVVSKTNEKVSISSKDVLSKLSQAIKLHKSLFFQIWQELVKQLQTRQLGSGNEITQRMFANSLKILARQTERFPVLSQYKGVIATYLSQDSGKFSEKFMSDVIDSQLGLDWLNHLIRLDMFKISLLQAYIKHNMEKSVIATDISGVQGPWSNFDLPMQERVWDYKTDDEEDFNDSTMKKQRQERYQLPSTYNDPYSFEEGFVWRELRNDPFSYGDEEENPYPSSGQPFSRP